MIYIFGVCQLSPTWYNVDCSQLMFWMFLIDLITINFNCSTRLWSIIQREIASVKLRKPLLTHSISHSIFTHCTSLFFCFSCVLTFLEIIKHNMLKMCVFSSIFNIKMATQIFTNFDKNFLMHTDMTAVTIQSNKIVSSELKTTKCYWSHLMKKNQTNFLANPVTK